MKGRICVALLMATSTLGAQVPPNPPGLARPSVRVAASESRTLNDVRRVVDQHKGRFYALYARALRDRPGLQGTIVLSISIAPDGKVTKCRVASSTLNHPELEKRIVERFAAIGFGAKGREAYHNAEYPLSFFST